MILHRPHRSFAQSLAIIIFFGILIISVLSLDQFRKTRNSIVHLFASNGLASPDHPREAVFLSAQELMSRPLASDHTKVPKLLHQSWKDTVLPARFQEWSKTCRRVNPEWEHVLWTDEDNLQLVEKYAPWFLDTYHKLKSEIYRADAMRNFYMHIFGGVYADLDTECLLPYDSLFANYSVPMAPHVELTTHSPDIEAEREKPERKAFLGTMHIPVDPHSGLPNAWMASSAGHPFWILPLESIEDNVSKDTSPEYLTGPDALFEVVRTYEREFAHQNSTTLDKHYQHSVWSRIHHRALSGRRELTPPPQSLELLPSWEVYPYSWGEQALIEVCWPKSPRFDAETCKDILGVDEMGSHSISYFGHSWEADQKPSVFESLKKASGEVWRWRNNNVNNS